MSANTIPAPVNATPDNAPAVPEAPVGWDDDTRRVWDALTVTGGGTVAAIAKAADVSQKITRTAIKIMFATDYVIREGDVWRPAPARAATVPDTDTAADTSPDPMAAATAPAAPGDAASAASATPDEPAPTPDGPPPAPVLTPDTIANAMQIMQAEADRRATATAELERLQAEEDARRAAIEAELARARAAESAREGLADLLATVTAAYAAVADGADQAGINAALAPVFNAVGALGVATGHARPRRARTAPGGVPTGGPVGTGDRKPPTPLRPAVAAHLNAHPGTDFTPGEIARVLDRSNGAVANALSTMASQGEAVLTSEKPMRYRAAVTAPAAPTTGDAPA
ncbi:hypothetical protein [Actinomadura rupiterrae]|uniref:hypothetical protein n=1 Tax=Actinomadura rupiterrae TaxID=559627 RepID=UPI0020A4BDFC|nr:hypothetical protein [Actinomadura rupiterrae]MCP2342947.1 hypothetical protein [Actinomadura rupiterrae]